MKNLAIITARGGSKRIPKKNIKEFCGRPIIAYSIEASLKSKIFDEVMVSTDSEEIADIAKKCGASVPFMRSSYNSSDYAVTVDVLREVLLEYRKQGQAFDNVACIYPTAPFITAEKLQDAYIKFIENHAESISSVVAFSFPPQRCQVIEDGFLKYKWPENYPKRSQDLEKYYHDAGQFYIYKTDALMNKRRVDWIEIPYVLSELEVQDIDNEIDWAIAELKYNLLKKEMRNDTNTDRK
ncbi:MAG: pseudaminic acid cytidylyltransferase [Eubacterium sp.]|nr:pseudaminic acid cytidylyltransferase [Eubacterium sp.]